MDEARVPAQPSSAADDVLLGVSLDTTAICNLRCTICSLEEAYHPKGVMSVATFERMRDALPTLRHVAFSSSAEPLLNPSLVDMVRIAKDMGGDALATSFTTNGTLLDAATSRALIDAGLDALEFSLDGATKHTYEKIRVRADFDAVIRNIAHLQAVKRATWSKKPHVSIRFTLSRENVHELFDLLDLARSLEIDHVVINGLEPYDEPMAEKVLWGREANPSLEILFTALDEKARGFGMRLDLPRLAPEPIDDCRLIDHACIVLWDGTVVPCSPVAYERPFHYFGERLVHPRVEFGNLNDAPLHEIWRSPAYVRFRDGLRNGTIWDFCEPCLKRAGVICPLKHWGWLADQEAPAAAGARPPRAWRAAAATRQT